MLTVRNLPPEPTLSDWFRDNNNLLAGLILWAAVLLCIAGAAPRMVESAWYNVSFVEGGLMYDRMPDEVACRASVVDNTTACLSGAELDGSGSGH
ncbi:hypothetical protein [Pseudomonas aeruginosa]|uniref:hypothetical protein n=1 Tax=Pseudomonas aeruginosa TaxID=287 RepID=UPI001EEF1415|nr:hypothetical protein [Pseudomonas aeruginosa]MCG7126555.1 hypothetical protein [Pseudomonas aeruginosa]MCG7151129.1 hypothetical protein [Pseudomonas aeruginosa]MCG7163961.1 hypothetical protein [Pseudomonas aeruginosa]MCG7171871.1 hypothetical protein [Pseudomonas aeruginosa]HDP4805345.1 hypothetical protein [Pseudomonas aeruginosa]